MNYKTILGTTVALAASAFLVGCGGGGGETAAPTSATPGQAQGIYSGSFVVAGQTGEMNFLALENDEYWALYGTPNSSGGLTVYGLIQGQGISNNGTFISTNLRDFSDGPTASGSLNATYNAGVSMSGTGKVDGQIGSYNLSSSPAQKAAFNTPANLADITGAWPGSDLSNTPFNLNIGSSGALTGGTTNGCTVSGSITPRPGGKNIFNVALTTASTAACGTAAGATGGGVAISSVLSSGKRQLLIALASTDRTKGTVLFANRSEGTTVLSGPVTSTLAYPLLSGYKAMVANGLSKSFAVTGTCTGTGTKSSSPAATAATFEGVAGLSATSTLTMSLTGTGCTPSIAQSSTSYFDNTYLPRGINSVGVNYGIFLSAPILPATAMVGSTGLIGTLTLYTSNTKLTGNGRIDSSYVIEADTASTGIFNLISKSYNASGTLTSTEQDRYRITSTGALTPISIDIQYANTSTAHLLLTF